MVRKVVAAFILLVIGAVAGASALWVALQVPEPTPATVDFWVKVAQVITIPVAIFAAVLAAAFAWRDIQEGRKLELEMNARRTWADYLRLAFEQGAFAAGKVNTGDEAKYDWFLAFTLMACEQVLQSFGHDKAWKAVVSAQLEHHKAALGTYDASRRTMYSKDLKALIESYASTPASTTPPVPPQPGTN